MTLCFAGFYFVPLRPYHRIADDVKSYNFTMDSIEGCRAPIV